MLDQIAGITELVGLWTVGNKRPIGFLINCLCNVLWIVYVVQNKVAYGLLWVVLPALVINLRNYFRWRIKK